MASPPIESQDGTSADGDDFRPSERVLVTGSRGFVGRNLIPLLRDKGFFIRELNRSDVGGTWDAKTPFGKQNLHCDTLIHLAARVHVMNETESEATLELYRQANVEAFRALICAGAAQGLKRVIFLSTSKVAGEESLPGSPFVDGMKPNPQGSYAVSKREAELMLRKLADELSLEFITLRPPLIYGPGVKANFLALAKAVQKGLPLPVPATTNRRSLLSVENLASAIVALLRKTSLPNREYFVSDPTSLSTEELILALGSIFGKKPRLIRVPQSLGRVLHATPIVKKKWSRLSGSFEIRSDGLATYLKGSWNPIPTNEALRSVFTLK